MSVDAVKENPSNLCNDWCDEIYTYNVYCHVSKNQTSLRINIISDLYIQIDVKR